MPANTGYQTGGVDITSTRISKDYNINIYQNLSAAHKAPYVFFWGRQIDSTTFPYNFVTTNTPFPYLFVDDASQRRPANTDWKQIDCCGSRGTFPLDEPILYEGTTETANTPGVAAGIKSNGTLWTWGGDNYVGSEGNTWRMGDPTIGNANRPIPKQVGTSTTWKQISVGYGASAAIKTDGTLWGWGVEYKYWTFAGRSSPTQEIGGGTDWKQVSYGHGQLLAIKANTTLWAYGRSFYGELGTNTWTSGAPAGSVGHETSSFVQIGNSQGWKQVSCGQRHSAAVKYDGTLWTWGRNKYGQLGIELTYPTTIANTSSPAQTIIGGNDWSLVSCGPFNTAAIKQDGTLWIWGSNAYGQVGNGKSALGDNLPEEENVPYPYKVPGQNWRQVICGYHLITALKTDGSLWSWGFNEVGCLGDGTYISKSSPVQISGGNNWKFICGKGSTQILAIRDQLNKPDGYNV